MRRPPISLLLAALGPFGALCVVGRVERANGYGELFHRGDRRQVDSQLNSYDYYWSRFPGAGGGRLQEAAVGEEEAAAVEEEEDEGQAKRDVSAYYKVGPYRAYGYEPRPAGYYHPSELVSPRYSQQQQQQVQYPAKAVFARSSQYYQTPVQQYAQAPTVAPHQYHANPPPSPSPPPQQQQQQYAEHPYVVGTPQSHYLANPAVAAPTSGLSQAGIYPSDRTALQHYAHHQHQQAGHAVGYHHHVHPTTTPAPAHYAAAAAATPSYPKSVYAAVTPSAYAAAAGYSTPRPSTYAYRAGLQAQHADVLYSVAAITHSNIHDPEPDRQPTAPPPPPPTQPPQHLVTTARPALLHDRPHGQQQQVHRSHLQSLEPQRHTVAVPTPPSHNAVVQGLRTADLQAQAAPPPPPRLQQIVPRLVTRPPAVHVPLRVSPQRPRPPPPPPPPRPPRPPPPAPPPPPPAGGRGTPHREL